MKCVIPGSNVKTLAKAIITLSKIGEDLHVEFLADELVLRAVSASKSAYGSFTFRQDFFIDFRNEGVARSRQFKHKDPHNRFRLYMKSLLPIFKPSHIAEQQLESLEIEADVTEARMHFSFVKKFRIVQKHSICLMETSLLQTAYTRKDTKSHVTASARLLTEIISHFSSKVVEITLTFDERQFSAINYTGDAPDPKHASQMQLIMDMNEFENYEIERATALTCTLRELKGIVSFISTFTYSSDVSGLTGLPIKLYFTGPGVPLLLYIESPNQYEASFVIATTEAGSDNHFSQQGAAQTNQQHQFPTANVHNIQPASSRASPVDNNAHGPPKFSRGEVDGDNLVAAVNEPQVAAPSAAGAFRKVGVAAYSSTTNKAIGYQASYNVLTQLPSLPNAAMEYLVGDTDDEEGSASDRGD